MANPYTIAAIEDIALSSSENIIAGLSGRTLENPSRVKVFMNRETVDLTVDIFVGANRTMVDGRVPINATDGDMPSIQDDMVVDTFGMAGDEIIIRGTNADAVAARELRAIIFVTEVDDASLQACMDQLASAGVNVAGLTI